MSVHNLLCALVLGKIVSVPLGHPPWRPLPRSLRPRVEGVSSVAGRADSLAL
jgi:hypothetical protein